MPPTYDDVTRCTIGTLLELTQMARDQVDAGQSAYWQMGQGAVMLWHRLVGEAAQIDDCRLFEMMLEDIPGNEDQANGLGASSATSTVALLARLSAGRAVNPLATTAAGVTPT